MPDWNQVYDNARTRKARAPERRRAMNPETGQIIPRFTFRQKFTLKAMTKFLALAIAWIVRRLTTALAGWAVIINAPPESVQGTTAFLTAAAVFGSELLLKTLRLWFLKLKGGKPVPPVLGLLLLLCALCLTALQACRTAPAKPTPEEQANAAFRELLDRDGDGYLTAAAEADEAHRAAWLLSIETLSASGTR